MLPELLEFTARSLAAWGAEKPRERPSSRRGQPAPGGPLWSMPVPASKAIVPFILAFARENQTFRLEMNDIPLCVIRIPEQPIAVVDGIIAPYQRQLLNGKIEHARQEVAFSSLPEAVRGQVKSICRADDWTTFGHLQTRFTPGYLKPEVFYVNGNAELVWRKPPRARWASKGPFGWGILQRWSETALLKFIIGPDRGEIVTDGRAKNFVLPDLEWK